MNINSQLCCWVLEEGKIGQECGDFSACTYECNNGSQLSKAGISTSQMATKLLNLETCAQNL